MRLRALIFAAILLGGCVTARPVPSPPAASPGLHVDRAEWALRAAVPHNEPDVFRPSRGDVARYEATAGGALRLGRVTLDVDGTLWGGQPWRAPEVVGKGLAAWGGSDWRAHRWAADWTAVIRWRLTWWLEPCAKYHGGDANPYFLTVGVCGGRH